MRADDLCGAAEPLKGLSPEKRRAITLLLVPDSVKDELEVRCFDACVGVVDHTARALLAERDLARLYLFEHQLNELRFGGHGLTRSRDGLIPAFERRDDRVASVLAVEVLDPQQMVEQAGHLAPEAVEHRQ